MKPIFLENNFLGKNWKGERKCHLGLGVTNSVGFLKKRVKIDIEERERVYGMREQGKYM